jgi:hypothetical protein
MKKKTITIDLKGKAYATVPARIKEFREQCPRGEIKTKPTIMDGGQILFEAYILKDKSDTNSASATGHAIGANKGDKAFEKLETISIGRALAILGFMASGDIASSEEMDDFEDYKKQKNEEAKQFAVEVLTGSKNLKELKDNFQSLGAFAGDKDIIKLKDELKLKLK